MTTKAKTLSGYDVKEQTVTEMADENLAACKEAGVKVRQGWDRKSPYPYEEQKIFHFQDHHYMLKYPDGRVAYCCEPYGLDADDITELAFLQEQGWIVTIGQMPLWYPGRTTQIKIERREE